VSKRTNPKKPANLRSWRVIIIRSKGEYLGSVESAQARSLTLEHSLHCIARFGKELAAGVKATYVWRLPQRGRWQ